MPYVRQPLVEKVKVIIVLNHIFYILCRTTRHVIKLYRTTTITIAATVFKIKTERRLLSTAAVEYSLLYSTMEYFQTNSSYSFINSG